MCLCMQIYARLSALPASLSPSLSKHVYSPRRSMRAGSLQGTTPRGMPDRANASSLVSSPRDTNGHRGSPRRQMRSPERRPTSFTRKEVDSRSSTLRPLDPDMFGCRTSHPSWHVSGGTSLSQQRSVSPPRRDGGGVGRGGRGREKGEERMSSSSVVMSARRSSRQLERSPPRSLVRSKSADQRVDWEPGYADYHADKPGGGGTLQAQTVSFVLPSVRSNLF